MSVEGKQLQEFGFFVPDVSHVSWRLLTSSLSVKPQVFSTVSAFPKRESLTQVIREQSFSMTLDPLISVSSRFRDVAI